VIPRGLHRRTSAGPSIFRGRHVLDFQRLVVTRFVEPYHGTYRPIAELLQDLLRVPSVEDTSAKEGVLRVGEEVPQCWAKLDTDPEGSVVRRRRQSLSSY
jgi:hypothetical protein